MNPFSFFLVYGVLLVAPTALIRRIQRCCCCIPYSINAIDDCVDFSDQSFDDIEDILYPQSHNATNNIPANVSTASESTYHDDILSSRKADSISQSSTDIVQTPDRHADISSSDESDPHEADSDDSSFHASTDISGFSRDKMKDTAIVFCNYLHVILKRITKDIVSIQTLLANGRIFRSVSLKIKVIEYRRKLRTCSNAILSLPNTLDPDHRAFNSMGLERSFRILRNQQGLLAQILRDTVNISVYNIKFMINITD